jgi:hypothetical protein
MCLPLSICGSNGRLTRSGRHSNVGTDLDLAPCVISVTLRTLDPAHWVMEGRAGGDTRIELRAGKCQEGVRYG